jgi:hypothetical protein
MGQRTGEVSLLEYRTDSTGQAHFTGQGTTDDGHQKSKAEILKAESGNVFKC